MWYIWYVLLTIAHALFLYGLVKLLGWAFTTAIMLGYILLIMKLHSNTHRPR